MKSRIFNKSAIVAMMALMATGNTVFAQNISTTVATPVPAVQPVVSSEVVVVPKITITSPVQVSISPVKVDLSQLKADMKELNVNIAANVKDIAPQISMLFKEGAEINTNESSSNDVNLVKNYSKVYPVDANDEVSIENKYGKVIVNTWARNEVKVDVEIKVGADDNDAAQKALDNVSISDSKEGDKVSFVTNIGETKSSWMSIFSGNNGNHHIEINYTVYMPAKNDLTIDNRYGPIQIPSMDGKITINSAYGSFNGGVLPNESAIRVKYGSAEIESVGNCAIDLSYGSLHVGSANKIAANVSYSGVKIGKLHEQGAINIRYGDGVLISDMDKGVQSLAINASYTNINIGLSGDENANFAVVTHYGDFNYDGHAVTITEKSPDDNDHHPHFTKSYKGYLGKGGSDRTIDINSNYGTVKFQ